MTEVKNCPFCGGPANTMHYNGTLEATCASEHKDCAGTDVLAPVAMWNRRAAAPAVLVGERAWQPMTSAPKDRDILLDVSYWYHIDRRVTASYVVGAWDSAYQKWICDDELRDPHQINAWMDIPATTLPRPAEEPSP